MRGEGLVLGIEFVSNKETKESFPVDWGRPRDPSNSAATDCSLILISKLDE